MTLGVDSFYEQAQHLIDEGQFGAPIILTPFNYRYGLIGGVEFSANYAVKNFSTYANLSFQAAHGKDVESSQFNLGPTTSPISRITTFTWITRGVSRPLQGPHICGRAHASAPICSLAPDCGTI